MSHIRTDVGCAGCRWVTRTLALRKPLGYCSAVSCPTIRCPLVTGWPGIAVSFNWRKSAFYYLTGAFAARVMFVVRNYEKKK